MPLSVLSIAYPLAPVGPDAVGGAEQMLCRLDEALVREGHCSIVIACEGSKTAGLHIPVSLPRGIFGDAAKAEAHAAVRKALSHVLDRWPVDIVHMHGVDFHAYLPPPEVPALATLHLPPSWYPAPVFEARRPGLWLNCVSRNQHLACPPSAHLVDPIENGVPIDDLSARHAKRGFGLVLGRICPEKGIHLAIAAAKRADIPLLIAGEVFPYEAHRRYFDEEVAPRLDCRRRFIGPVGFVRKRRLLTAARCLLVPSLAEETSSLVAREAAACGTAVIAFPNGVLAETVEHDMTGFLVPDAEAMADAIARAGSIDPRRCRETARKRFSLGQMTARYLSAYRQLSRPMPATEGAA